MSSSSPLPSRLCSIAQLPTFSPGDKVRFLGCVNQYNHSSALLHLFHNFPSKSPRYVQVDITQLLDTVDHQHLQAGAWLNIIGYVTTASLTTKSKVQAIMLWSAGPIHLQQYEDALLARQMT